MLICSRSLKANQMPDSLGTIERLISIQSSISPIHT
jgi:hypothetical protein